MLEDVTVEVELYDRDGNPINESEPILGQTDDDGHIELEITEDEFDRSIDRAVVELRRDGYAVASRTFRSSEGESLEDDLLQLDEDMVEEWVDAFSFNDAEGAVVGAASSSTATFEDDEAGLKVEIAADRVEGEVSAFHLARSQVFTDEDWDVLPGDNRGHGSEADGGQSPINLDPPGGAAHRLQPEAFVQLRLRDDGDDPVTFTEEGGGPAVVTLQEVEDLQDSDDWTVYLRERGDWRVAGRAQRDGSDGLTIEFGSGTLTSDWLLLAERREAGDDYCIQADVDYEQGGGSYTGNARLTSPDGHRERVSIVNGTLSTVTEASPEEDGKWELEIWNNRLLERETFKAQAADEDTQESGSDFSVVEGGVCAADVPTIELENPYTCSVQGEVTAGGVGQPDRTVQVRDARSSAYFSERSTTGSDGLYRISGVPCRSDMELRAVGETKSFGFEGDDETEAVDIAAEGSPLELSTDAPGTAAINSGADVRFDARDPDGGGIEVECTGCAEDAEVQTGEARLRGTFHIAPDSAGDIKIQVSSTEDDRTTDSQRTIEFEDDERRPRISRVERTMEIGLGDNETDTLERRLRWDGEAYPDTVREGAKIHYEVSAYDPDGSAELDYEWKDEEDCDPDEEKPYRLTCGSDALEDTNGTFKPRIEVRKNNGDLERERTIQVKIDEASAPDIVYLRPEPREVIADHEGKNRDSIDVRARVYNEFGRRLEGEDNEALSWTLEGGGENGLDDKIGEKGTPVEIDSGALKKNAEYTVKLEACDPGSNDACSTETLTLQVVDNEVADAVVDLAREELDEDPTFSEAEKEKLYREITGDHFDPEAADDPENRRRLWAFLGGLIEDLDEPDKLIDLQRALEVDADELETKAYEPNQDAPDEDRAFEPTERLLDFVFHDFADDVLQAVEDPTWCQTGERDADEYADGSIKRLELDECGSPDDQIFSGTIHIYERPTKEGESERYRLITEGLELVEWDDNQQVLGTIHTDLEIGRGGDPGQPLDCGESEFCVLDIDHAGARFEENGIEGGFRYRDFQWSLSDDGVLTLADGETENRLQYWWEQEEGEQGGSGGELIVVPHEDQGCRYVDSMPPFEEGEYPEIDGECGFDLKYEGDDDPWIKLEYDAEGIEWQEGDEEKGAASWHEYLRWRDDSSDDSDEPTEPGTAGAIDLPREDSDAVVRITGVPDEEAEDALEVDFIQFAEGACNGEEEAEKENYLFLVSDPDWKDNPVLWLGERRCGEELLNEANAVLLAEAHLEEVAVRTGGWDGDAPVGAGGGDGKLSAQPYVLEFVGEVLPADGEDNSRYSQISAYKDQDGDEDIPYEAGDEFRLPLYLDDTAWEGPDGDNAEELFLYFGEIGKVEEASRLELNPETGYRLLIDEIMELTKEEYAEVGGTVEDFNGSNGSDYRVRFVPEHAKEDGDFSIMLTCAVDSDGRFGDDCRRGASMDEFTDAEAFQVVVFRDGGDDWYHDEGDEQWCGSGGEALQVDDLGNVTISSEEDNGTFCTVED
ncbi:hypothetical protein CKO14_02870 [Halorhodospira halophila]|nr:hypothetical protein [Halorhodospira halophila]